MTAKHSTEHLTDEVAALRRMLLWTVEWVDFHLSEDDPVGLPCRDCGHLIEHHVGHPPEDGSTCLYPQSMGAPMTLCACLQFMPPSSDD